MTRPMHVLKTGAIEHVNIVGVTPDRPVAQCNIWRNNEWWWLTGTRGLSRRPRRLVASARLTGYRWPVAYLRGMRLHGAWLRGFKLQPHRIDRRLEVVEAVGCYLEGSENIISVYIASHLEK